MSSKLQPIFVISNTQKRKNAWEIFFLLSISNKTMLCWFGTKTSLFEIGYCFTLRRAKISCFMPFQVGNNLKKAAAASDGHYVWFSWFWSHLKKYSHVVARLPQRLKSTLFEIFSTLRVPFRHPPFEKISNNVDFSLWGKQCIVPQKWDQNCENHT